MYNKSECHTGVVHIGYGNFHRAHQAKYIDEYMEKTGDLRWGIVAVDNFVRNERLWGDIPSKYVTFTRELKTMLLSQTYEKEIDLLLDDVIS